MSTALDLRKTPTSDPEAEYAVLAACLTSARDCDDAYEALELSDFFAPAHRSVWQAIVALYEDNSLVDLTTAISALRRLGTLDIVGGPAYVAQMAAASPMGGISAYVGILKDAAKRRKLANRAARLHAAACDPACSGEKLEELAADVTDVTDVTEDTGCHSKSPDVTADVTARGEKARAASYGKVTSKIDLFVKSSPGSPFSMNDVYQACDANTGKEKTAARKQISRLLAQNVLLRERQNTYLYLENNYQRVDVLSKINEPKTPFPLDLPLDLGKLCFLYPKNLVVIAGQSSAGKTAFLFDIARRNIGQPYGRPHYLMAEMCDDELVGRLQDMPEEVSAELAGGVDFIECETHAEHYIKLNNPDGLNIFDYLKADGDDFLYVSKYIDDIHLATRKGVTVLAIQKMAGKSHGVGGGHTESKPRLYITLDKFQTAQGMLYKARIVKAKFPRGKWVLDGMECLYALHSGWDIEKIHKWDRLDDKGWQAVASEYWAAQGGACPC